jgi:hypothetical protein
MQSPLALIGFVDAAHTTDVKTRHSVTGWFFTFAGGAVVCKSKLQTTVATRSTELEFLTAVHAAKMAKYRRSVLSDLGFPQDGPTLLCEDKQAAISMINENKPSPLSRHIVIQHFTIQEWRRWGIISMKYFLSGVIHPADGSTKALGWALHFRRHARRAMGHSWDTTAYDGISPSSLCVCITSLHVYLCLWYSVLHWIVESSMVVDRLDSGRLLLHEIHDSFHDHG